MFDPRINHAPEGFNPTKELPAGFMDFFLPLHRKFTPWQQKLARRREQVLEDAEFFKWRLEVLLGEAERAAEGKIGKPHWRRKLPRLRRRRRRSKFAPNNGVFGHEAVRSTPNGFVRSEQLRSICGSM
jgi:hypothetical protein